MEVLNVCIGIFYVRLFHFIIDAYVHLKSKNSSFFQHLLLEINGHFLGKKLRVSILGKNLEIHLSAKTDSTESHYFHSAHIMRFDG